MKETIAEIAQSIRTHRDLEITSETSNNSIGGSRTIFKHKDHIFWLTAK